LTDKKLKISGGGDFVGLEANSSEIIIDSGRGIGINSKDCIFKAKYFGENTGNSAKNCSFFADVMEKVGFDSEICKFYARKRVTIQKKQDGSSRYFLDDREVKYEFNRHYWA